VDRLRAIEIFIRAADLGSFYKTGITLGVTPQAISKAIRQLETELGVTLFHRTKRNSSLTEEGRSFLERVRPGAAAVASAWEHAQRSTAQDTGLIRITAPIGVGRLLVVPMIKAFRATYMNVEFDLMSDDRHTDIVSEGIDLGFRCGLPPSGQLVVHELMRLQLIACASPSYLADRGVPRSREDLVNHVCIGSRRPNTGRVIPWELGVKGGIDFQPVHAAFSSTDVGTELEAVLQGIGVGMLDGILCIPYLRNGQLVPVLCDLVSERYGVYLYHAHRPDTPQRVRRFVEHASTFFHECGGSFRIPPKELSALHREFLRRSPVVPAMK